MTAAHAEQLDRALDLIPPDRDNLVVKADGKRVSLTNLRKVYFPDPGGGFTKGDLLRYYAAVSEWLLPHLVDRAMVMKRYPSGIGGPFFFMKRTPSHAPDWLVKCSIAHASKSVIDFPVIKDLASLLWVVNLGCIDLNPWYARCDDTNRPDYLHFDLDPVVTKGKPVVPFARVVEVAFVVKEALGSLGMSCYAKTTGSRGVHLYVPIVRGPTQKEVWTFAKSLAFTLAKQQPGLITAEYRIAKRPAGRVLVDYNQNAWGRTLASVYSVRPKAGAPVSAPVTWDELAGGVRIEDFRLDNVPDRLAEVGDLWAPLNYPTKGRVKLEDVL